MNRGQVLAVLTGMLLAGCMTGRQAVEQLEDSTVRISIGWIRQLWRTCEEGDTCPQPTRKTIALAPQVPIEVAPQPTPKPRRESKEARRMSLSVHFGRAKAKPTPAGRIELENVLSQIRENDSIQIQGHTDDIGSAAFNDRLARRRAWFVATWLKRRGVANPMEVKARGKCCYVAANDSDEGRAANRRVVVVLNTSVRKEPRR